MPVRVLQPFLQALAAAALGASLVSLPVQAQAPERRPLAPGYPTKPVRLIIGIGPGGGMDTVTRMVVARLNEHLPTTIVAENMPAGTGTLAVNTVMNAAADGYTLLAISGSIQIGAAFKKFADDPRTRLQAVQQMSYQPYVMIARIDAPFNSMQELVAAAKKAPGKLTYGSTGQGSPIHMGTALIEYGAGIQMTHVPYKSGAGSQQDMAGGRLDMALTAISGLTLVRAGKAKLLGITSTQRHPDFPDTPTMAETIIPGFEFINNYGTYAPIKTPAAIVNGLNKAIQQVVNEDEFKKKLVADASMPGPVRSPADWQKAFVSEVDRWEQVIKKADLKLEE